MAEPAGTAFAIPKFLDYLEPDLLNRHEYHLCDAFPWLDLVRFAASVPARDKYLSLIVGIDQARQVAEHKTMFMSEPGARKQYRRQAAIANVNRDAGGNQLGITRAHSQRLVDTRAHIKARGSVGRIVRQGYGLPNSGIQYLQFNRSQCPRPSVPYGARPFFVRFCTVAPGVPLPNQLDQLRREL